MIIAGKEKQIHNRFNENLTSQIIKNKFGLFYLESLNFVHLWHQDVTKTA